MEKYELFSADTYKKIKTFFQLREHTFCAMEALFSVNGSNFLSVVQLFWGLVNFASYQEGLASVGQWDCFQDN
jgi:hypothetical protein